MANLVNTTYPGIEYPYFKVLGPAADGTFVKMTASDEVTLVSDQGDEAIGVMIETFLPDNEYYVQAADEKQRCAVMVGQGVLEFTSWSGAIVTGNDVSFDPTDGRPRAAIAGDTIYGKCIEHSEAKVRVLLYGHGNGVVAA